MSDVFRRGWIKKEGKFRDKFRFSRPGSHLSVSKLQDGSFRMTFFPWFRDLKLNSDTEAAAKLEALVAASQLLGEMAENLREAAFATILGGESALGGSEIDPGPH